MEIADGSFDAALLQGFAARIAKAGLDEIAKAGQRSRGGAGADEAAVACKGRDRRLDPLDQALQPLARRDAAADRIGARDQDAVTAIGEIEPRAAAGRKRAERRAEAAQSFQPERAGQR